LITSLVWGNVASDAGEEAYFASTTTFAELRVSLADTTGFAGPYQAKYDRVLALDPEFCDPSGNPQGVEGYSVASSSPCRPENNPWGAAIGAFGAGCTVTPVRTVSWSFLKGATEP
jgi:hypothetical protein